MTETILKLVLAVALGGLIGLERESSNKPAGLRTNILICVGSAAMMILSFILVPEESQNNGNVTRIAAGVITGIGFIGAGTIIQSRGNVAGLTTAATIWAVSGLGLLIGSGNYVIALIFTVLIILVLVIFRYFEDHRSRKNHFFYTLKLKEIKDSLTQIRKLAFHIGIDLRGFTIKKENKFAIVVFNFFSKEENEKKFSQSLAELTSVLELKID
ncbi:MAG: MgtC/SapB family protein [Candidatus Aminicenantes bacterium]|nr:MgtC/SapB family protein [Candidatus Aminicenantes bacterium]